MKLFSINIKSVNRHRYVAAAIFKACLFFTAALLIFSSCKKELAAPTPAPLDAGVLSASKDTVVIDAANPASEAVKFSWTASKNSLIAFSIILSVDDKTDTVAVPQNAVSKTFSNSELNNILVAKFGLPIGEAVVVKAFVIAKVTINDKEAKTNEISINATPVPTGPAYKELWIVGNATPNGWDINNPNKLKVDPTNEFQFKYNEVLNTGEFKIPVTTGSWGTDYFMPPTNHPAITSTDVQLIPGGNPDNKWEITTAGAYKILLNISSNPSIKITPFTPYPNLWIVGNATPAGWDIDHPTPMLQTPGNPYEFTYTGPLSAGEFKIPTSTGNWGTDYFMPPAGGAGVTETNAILIPGGNPDNKWTVAVAGNYKITLNQLYETISIIKQ